MPGDVDAHTAQLLNQPPDLGAAGRNLLRKLRAAHDYGSVFHQRMHNTPEADVRRRLIGRCSWRAGPIALPSCARLGDAQIMRESSAKDKLSSAHLRREEPRRTAVSLLRVSVPPW